MTEDGKSDVVKRAEAPAPPAPVAKAETPRAEAPAQATLDPTSLPVVPRETTPPRADSKPADAAPKPAGPAAPTPAPAGTVAAESTIRQLDETINPPLGVVISEIYTYGPRGEEDELHPGEGGPRCRTVASEPGRARTEGPAERRYH